jgi:maleate isomerase
LAERRSFITDKKQEYLVGSIKPTGRPGAKTDPKLSISGVKQITVSMNFTEGTEAEFGASMSAYEAKVAELATMKVDLIQARGAPPFMLLGFKGEQEIINVWEKKYSVPILTSARNHVRALRTLGVAKFIGASYFPRRLNDIFETYFREAGFDVLAIEGINVPFADVPKLPAADVYEHVIKMCEKYADAEGMYMLGGAWKTIDIIDRLERTMGLPVIHAAAARCWETQMRLGLRQPVTGCGRLLAEMPALADLD